MHIYEPRIDDHVSAVEGPVRRSVERTDSDDSSVFEPQIDVSENMIERITGNQRVDLLQACQHNGILPIKL